MCSRGYLILPFSGYKRVPRDITKFIKTKQDDKPGYVSNDHLSRTTVTSSLKRPTCKRAGSAHSSLFGLASDGVYMCPSCYQNGGSLLHCHSNLTLVAQGGIFLLHWPWSHLHRTLSGILPYEARTFLTCQIDSRDHLSCLGLNIKFNYILNIL